MTMTNHVMTNPLAIVAVQAAMLRYGKNIGRHASWRFAERQGVPYSLYRLACQCEWLKRAGL